MNEDGRKPRWINIDEFSKWKEGDIEAVKKMICRKDEPPFHQCCCQCVNLYLAKDGSYTCYIPGMMASTNWYRHAVGCEMHNIKRKKNG